MPRRYATYLPKFATWHQVATVGAFIMLFGQLAFVWNMWQSWRYGKRVDDADPWNLKESDQFTNEWRWYQQNRAPAIADGGDDAAEESDD